MSTETIRIDKSIPELESLSSTNDELYSTYDNPSLSNSPSKEQSSISSKSQLISDQCRQKDSLGKVPYPVLSDHRDPSSVLILLQKETQTTSKKILNVTEQITTCEQRLNSNLLSEQEKKMFKYERVKFKQQLDALKKHERRISLQIDFITTKTEIKGLEDEQQQNLNEFSGDQSEQIKILLGKLKQKLDKMKIYMRTRNEQMKKINNGKSKSNELRKTSASSLKQAPSTIKEQNRKHSLSSVNNLHPNKRLKPMNNHHNHYPHKAPAIRLTSRMSNHDHKNHSTRTPIVRFIKKTTDSNITAINSASPTTPASSSSTLSPPLIATTSNGDLNIHLPTMVTTDNIVSMDDDDDDDDEFDLELDMDELFEGDDSTSNEQIKQLKSDVVQIKKTNKSERNS